VLRTLHDFAMFGTFGVLPAALIGAASEGTRRARIVAALATVMLFLNCAHFPLFDCAPLAIRRDWTVGLASPARAPADH
jgi:hypothetical protein